MIAAAALAVALAAGGGTGGGGYVEEPADVRRCLTPRELWITPGGLSRPEAERRWEVRGKSYRVSVAFLGAGWGYPLCDDPDRLGFAQFEPGSGLVTKAVVVPNEDQ